MRQMIASLLLLLGACTDAAISSPLAISSVGPGTTCGHANVVLNVEGDGFSDDAVVDFPRVGDEGSLDVQQDRRAVIDGKTILIEMSSEEGGPGSSGLELYDLRVRNPDGEEAVLPGALTMLGEPRIEGISPSVAATGSNIVFTVTGALYGHVTVELGARPVTSLLSDMPDAVDGRVSGSLDLHGVPRGTYAVVVRDAGGCEAAIDNAFTVE